jgi:hypothetical protein
METVAQTCPEFMQMIVGYAETPPLHNKLELVMYSVKHQGAVQEKKSSTWNVAEMLAMFRKLSSRSHGSLPRILATTIFPAQSGAKVPRPRWQSSGNRKAIFPEESISASVK